MVEMRYVRLLLNRAKIKRKKEKFMDPFTTMENISCLPHFFTSVLLKAQSKPYETWDVKFFQWKTLEANLQPLGEVLVHDCKSKKSRNLLRS